MKILLPFIHGLSKPRNVILNLDNLSRGFDMYGALRSGNLINWEPEVLASLASVACVYNARNFLDIGANIGFYGLAMASMFEDLDVVAIEPTPFLVEYQKRLFEKNNIENVSILECALSNRCGKEKFYITAGNSTSSLIERQTTDIIEVNLQTLNNLYQDNNFDLVKIDTEGTENNVIEGGAEAIQSNKPFIVLECLNRNHLNGTEKYLDGYNFYLLKKDFTIEQFPWFINPEKRGEWNWLLSPVELDDVFIKIYGQWINNLMFISDIKEDTFYKNDILFLDKNRPEIMYSNSSINQVRNILINPKNSNYNYYRYNIDKKIQIITSI